MAKKRLGRGLDALIPTVEQPSEESQGRIEIEIALIDPNPFQPRRRFDSEKLQELADSIKLHGVLQPVVLRKVGDRYQLVAGERRCRAAKLARLAAVPALVRDYSDRDLLEIAIVENLQRHDLNPLEEAMGYEQLMSNLGFTQEKVAERVGKSRPYVANHLRLLHLPQVVQEYVSRGTITAGHARALLGLKEETMMLEMAERIVSEGLNVRQVERLVQQSQATPVSRETKQKVSPEWADVERRLQLSFGTNVRIVKAKKRGRIEIEYYSPDELERLIEILLTQSGEIE